MPAMSPREVAFCQSGAWRAFAGRVVLPWALQGFEPHGDVLEIGAGSGAMAAAVLERSPSVNMTVTDFDPLMVDAASARLASFGTRATVRQADATALPFADSSFDAVLSWTMLHHTIDWEKALAECVRVLRPGGHVVGFDLLKTVAFPWHRHEHAHDHEDVRTMTIAELRSVIGELPVDQAVLIPSLFGLTVRFLLRSK